MLFKSCEYHEIGKLQPGGKIPVPMWKKAAKLLDVYIMKMKIMLPKRNLTKPCYQCVK